VIVVIQLFIGILYEVPPVPQRFCHLLTNLRFVVPLLPIGEADHVLHTEPLQHRNNDPRIQSTAEGHHDLATLCGFDKPLEDMHKDFVETIQQIFFRVGEEVPMPEAVIKVRGQGTISFVVDKVLPGLDLGYPVKEGVGAGDVPGDQELGTVLFVEGGFRRVPEVICII